MPPSSLGRSVAAALVASLTGACTSDSNAPGAPDEPPGPGAMTGKLAYAFVATIDGKLDDAIHVLDLATRRELVFRAVASLKGGVSAARDGTLAQLGELDDAATIRISNPDGATRRDSIVRAELSFATSGAAISPDASRVAFSFDVALTDGRGARTYVCPVVGTDACATFDGVKSPAWAPDGRLLVVTDDQAAVLVSDAAVTRLDRVGPGTLTRAENPIMTPDGRYIIFDQGEISRLSLLEVATGAVTPLTEGGLGQFRAALSPDGATLLFQQKCCGDLAPRVVTLHAIPFTTSPTVTPLAVHTVDDQAGDPLAVAGRAAWF
jgi:DNA-binding beta-propeller fold protein YncE